MAISKREVCFEKIRYSDPGWYAGVIPVAGSQDVCIVMTRTDPYTGRPLFGQILSRFCHRKSAEKLCRELNEFKDRLLATAYP